ncbi:DEAD/DEAH box helicase [Novosphingobium taihuense]|uniref:Superfamily II DNA or RNA helicase n=1 Tax=Novosphingobium taihuense TaxID=260085 RepID=A0A7W7EXX2_9SPHN|nr:DEAD/DEAH box helicase [Novosphingobium taihuense]MBB4615770.1 superfamily II DNA or RNA helicase [Novosphingobium taihuense]TWH79686.1 SNF2 domain-containing protein [Novosphingobium taihuense]
MNSEASVLQVSQVQIGDLVQARGREWIVLAKPTDTLLRVRPLSGSEEDAVLLAPKLEREKVRPATFSLPTPQQLDSQDAARLLADALRLSLRRGAGPFRSAAHLGVEPRAYQLVPMLMAMRLDVKRLLIADDVGIGKTIEAGMILREMLDRGEVDSFTVLCPPHLVDQWVAELAEKFDIDAVAVTSARARALEQGIALGDTIFGVHPFTVVSLDYIKADSRRESFAQACPAMVIVDEAHACVGGSERGIQQRFSLLERLAEDAGRHMLLLTATPHSGNQDAYARLLSLLHPDLAGGPDSPDPNAVERYRRRLAQHFVQRRRPDIADKWGEARAFAKAMKADAPYTLTGDFQAFQEDVLEYCLGVATRADGERARRLAFWGTLALMRCVGSSPAAAVSALRNRLGGMAEEAALEPVLFDADEGQLADNDVEPATAPDSEEAAELKTLITRAENLAARFGEDPKLRELVRQVKVLIEKGARPVIFCRFITTAEALGEALRAQFKKQTVEVVTGRLTPEERRERVEALADFPDRILVATDCLSEGINLQSLFSAVVHYDLNWNPTRHQQRDGRVDRFGQQAEQVFSIMMFGANSIIDGAVIKVITEKMRRIEKETGVVVPIPEDSASVSSALMQAMLLDPNRSRRQIQFDFGDADQQLEIRWKDAEETARKSQTRYAQGALKPEEVLPEWQRMRDLLGAQTEVERFTRRALARVETPMGEKGRNWRVRYEDLPLQLAEKLKARGLTGTRTISFADHPAPDVAHVGRTHPLVATLAETMAEGALDPGGVEGKATLGRAGAWRTRAVQTLTTVLLLRLRFKLKTSGRRTLLAEEATAIAFGPDAFAHGPEALALLEPQATGDLAEHIIPRQVEQALSRLPQYQAAIAAHAQERAAALREDHDRVRAATRGEGVTTEVEAVLPADVIGIYVLVPEAN